MNIAERGTVYVRLTVERINEFITWKHIYTKNNAHGVKNQNNI